MRRAVVAALLVLLAAGSAATHPAGAQTAVLRLVSQSRVVGPGEELVFVVSVSGAVPDDAEVAVTVNGAFEEARAGVRAALAGDLLTPVDGVVTKDVADIPRDAGGRLAVTIPTVVRSRDRRPGVIRLGSPGMYPVRVEIRADGDQVSEPMLTFVTRVDDPAAPGPPLAVTTVLTADTTPTLQPDGTTVITDRDREHLRTLASALDLAGQPGVPVAIRPDLVDALDRTGLPADAELASTLAASLAPQHLVASTFVRVDPTGLVESGLEPELTNQLRRGEDILDTVLGSPPSRTTWIGGLLDEVSLDVLRDLGVRQVVAPEAALVPADAPVDRLVELRSASGAAVPAAVADPLLGQALQPASDPLLSAEHLVAELAAIAIDAADDVPGGVVLLPPRDWRADVAFLDALLDGIAQHPLLQVLDLDELFRAVPIAESAGAALVRRPVDRPPSDLVAFAEPLALTRLAAASYGSMLDPAGALESEVGELLDTSLSADLDNAGRQPYLDAANQLIDPLRSAIDPIPDRRITLAGKRSELPITLQTSLPYPVTVRILLASPKLEFPEGNPLVTVNGTAQLRIPVEARASGVFTMTMQAVTPEGELPAGPTEEITVQARVLTGLGIVLGVGGLLVLATWWVHNTRTTRRRNRATKALSGHPSAGATGASAEHDAPQHGPTPLRGEPPTRHDATTGPPP